MILGGPENEARVDAVESVMARNGFPRPCFADLRSQGEGLWFVLIGVAPAAFRKSFAEAAGEDAWRAPLHPRRRLAQKRWENSGRKVLLPGLPEPGDNPPQIMIDSILPDEAWEALFDIDYEALGGVSFEWSRERRAWMPRKTDG